MNTTIELGFLLFFFQNGGGGGLVGLLLPWILIFGIFYFLVIRPQQRKQRQAQTERETMLKALKPGDKVITSSGIYGTIVAVREKEDTVLVRIAQSVSIEMLRSSIAGLQSSDIKEVEAVK
ncbi:MAG TPA: preprotein translocase subunit YajC [Blastocatellia bacterium]|nr:preprotein translocase subunit YajC [Blastocatellia bacterium]